MTVQQHQAKDGRLPQSWEEAGQTMVEYGLVLMTVALIALGGYQVFGAGVADLVNNVTAVW